MVWRLGRNLTAWEKPNIPTTAPGRSKFNIRYFDRDSRRAPDTVRDEDAIRGLDVTVESDQGSHGVLCCNICG